MINCKQVRLAGIAQIGSQQCGRMRSSDGKSEKLIHIQILRSIDMIKIKINKSAVESQFHCALCGVIKNVNFVQNPSN